MDISVVVPVYNSEKYIEACIDALLSQNYPKDKCEIIVVDNNSMDSSTAIIKGCPSIRLISEGKQGSYAARNRGIQSSKGRVIAFTDPDCVPNSDWLQEISVAMESSDVQIVLGKREPGSDNAFLLMIGAYENTKDEYVFSNNNAELYFGYTNNMAVRKELFSELGLFIERPRGADTIFVRRTVETHSPASVRYCPGILVRHMELDGLHSYYRKMFIYGRSRRMYMHISNTRALNNYERRHIFRRTVKRSGYGPVGSAMLFSLLSIGLVYWKIGRWSGALNSRTGRQ